MVRNKLPLESTDEYTDYLKHHPELLRQPRYVEEMHNNEMQFKHDHFMLQTTKLDLWLMRLVMIALMIVALSQIYRLIF